MIPLLPNTPKAFCCKLSTTLLLTTNLLKDSTGADIKFCPVLVILSTLPNKLPSSPSPSIENLDFLLASTDSTFS
jgi:hypothetical protein